jgi:tRNA pseudouridine55 synthase
VFSKFASVLGLANTISHPAIHKPRSISSFDVIRTVSPLFRQSSLFQPLIERERANRQQGPNKRKTRHKAKLEELKIGHGGTLDPLATGVLIVGIGNGTKSLQQFLDGTKEYECTVLFGAATDSYDILGKVTKTASWEGITKEKVEKALDTLRGDQMQLPPVYSAIRVDGKHLYEYAREGLPMPEIKRRAVTVHELELLEWLPSDQHSFELPSQEADAESKLLAERVAWPKSLLSKRKREIDEGKEEDIEPAQKIARSSSVAEEPKDVQGKTPGAESTTEPQISANENAAGERTTKSRPPAARIRMMVSSGFYVRSLCHDLGVALGSAGLMATLIRSRQSGFEIGKNVIAYDDFEKGEEVWEPKVKKSLEDWQEKQAEKGAAEGHWEGRKNNKPRGDRDHRDRKPVWKDRPRKSYENRDRRNSSSPEPDRRRQRNTSSPEPERRRQRNTSSPD